MQWILIALNGLQICMALMPDTTKKQHKWHQTYLLIVHKKMMKHKATAESTHQMHNK
jgi:hypothetical protein